MLCGKTSQAWKTRHEIQGHERFRALHAHHAGPQDIYGYALPGVRLERRGRVGAGNQRIRFYAQHCTTAFWGPQKTSLPQGCGCYSRKVFGATTARPMWMKFLHPSLPRYNPHASVTGAWCILFVAGVCFFIVIPESLVKQTLLSLAKAKLPRASSFRNKLQLRQRFCGTGVPVQSLPCQDTGLVVCAENVSNFQGHLRSLGRKAAFVFNSC